jgi:hypothetical protein
MRKKLQGIVEIITFLENFAHAKNLYSIREFCE